MGRERWGVPLSSEKNWLGGGEGRWGGGMWLVDWVAMISEYVNLNKDENLPKQALFLLKCDNQYI